MDTATRERLVNARARLRAAVERAAFPEWLTPTAQRCLIDLDCALSDGLSGSQVRMLLAQVEALVSVAGTSGRTPGGHGADPR